MVYTLRFFLFKCSLFHNSNLFGSCIIHNLYTECAKIKKNNSGAKRLRERHKNKHLLHWLLINFCSLKIQLSAFNTVVIHLLQIDRFKTPRKNLGCSLRTFSNYFGKSRLHLSKFIKVSINALFEKFSRKANFRLKYCTNKL
jgi:hypothetical protein